MGIDGMSAWQLNQSRDLPSSHHAINAETLANMKKDEMMVDFDQFTRNQQIDRKEDGYGEDVENTTFSGGDTSPGNEHDEDSENEEDQDDDLPYEKRYELHLGKAGIIELYDNELEQVIDTIEADNLLEIASKLNYAQGLIVTKKA